MLKLNPSIPKGVSDKNRELCRRPLWPRARPSLSGCETAQCGARQGSLRWSWSQQFAVTPPHQLRRFFTMWEARGATKTLSTTKKTLVEIADMTDRVP